MRAIDRGNDMDVSEIRRVATKQPANRPYDVRQARIDLTAALRLAARMGLSEGVCNHFSLEVPGEPDRFLINPQGLHWSEITPGDLMVVDASGKVVEGRHAVEPTAFFIHFGVHKVVKKKCVLHTHMPCATALTLLEDPTLETRANQNAMRFHGRVGYDMDFGGPALAADEGERIAQAAGGKDIVFMAHHGVMVCNDRIDYAFDDLYYLERSCMVQVKAMSTGRKLRLVSEEMAAKTARDIEGERQQSELHFAALKRLLDRDEPGWSQYA
jgi:ribulose-5-phosphate 4-epimerase/fuculose-1-phosphate aldolase